MDVIKSRIKNVYQQLYRTNRHSCLVISYFIFIFLLSFCSFTQAQSTVQANSFDDTGNYKIGAGDVLKVLVLKQDILSQDGIRVSNEGTIRMPMIAEAIPVACLTETQLASEITNRYKKYLLNPQVYVTVKEFNAYPIAIIGAVNSPGRFQLKRPTRLFDILSQVNGPNLNAGQFIQIFRDSNIKQCEQNSIEDPKNLVNGESPQQEIISLSLTELMKGNEAANPFLQAGDIIRVTEADIKQAYIIGNVKSAITVNLKEQVTLSRAIAMAGGISAGANIEKVKISRQLSGSLTKTEIIVNLKDINKRNQEDILLQANDIVEVPSDKGIGKTLKDIFRGIIPAVTRVPIALP